MELEDMVAKVQEVAALLQEIEEACRPHLINEFRIDDHLSDARENIADALNLLQIEMI
jgi:chemotaxis regulatin CheY-phosphate phosphatase CheZ